MRRGLLTCTLSFLSCLNHLSSTSLTSFCSGFRNIFILNSFSQKALIIFVLLLLPSDAQNDPLFRDCSHVITLPVCC